MLSVYGFINTVKDLNLNFTATFKLTGTANAMDGGPYDEYYYNS